ncbi:hypothetical protein Sa4125_29190 [Aureimonas sp. SA4125]|nr:hypothetical protein Sa4125_29190 [Aureimonas sp. SA4125]
MPGGPILVTIDGSHCDRLRKAFEVQLRIADLLEWLADPSRARRCLYYRDLRDETEAGRLRGMMGRLAAEGIEVKGAQPADFERGQKERYGTNLVELAVDLLRLAPGFERVVLVAADRKLVPLVRALRDGGTWVTLATALDVPVAIRASSHLVEAADDHVDFGDFLLSARGGLH